MKTKSKHALKRRVSVKHLAAILGFSMLLFSSLWAQPSTVKLGIEMPDRQYLRMAIAYAQDILPRFSIEVGGSLRAIKQGEIREYEKGLWFNPRYFFVQRKQKANFGLFIGPILTLDQSHLNYIPDREKWQSETFLASGIMAGFQVEILDRLWVQNEFALVRQFNGTRKVFFNRSVYEQYPLPTDYAFFAVLTIGYSLGKK